MRPIRFAAVLAPVLALALACSAQAAFPGANGKIAAKNLFPADVYAMNPDGSGQTAVTTGSPTDGNPAWSPDGTKIAFDRDSDIYLINADGSNPTRLTTDPATDTNPAWSPDATHLVFQSDRAGSIDLWKMNADGSSQERLTTDPATDADPAWSPDGTKIAFSSNRESFVCDDPDNFPDCAPRPTFRIFTIDPGGGSTHRITVTQPYFDCYSEGTDNVAPDWSPAGDQIAYMEYEYDNCVNETYFLRIVTTGWSYVFNAPDYSTGLDPFEPPAAGPAWSPDGRQIAFHLSRTLRVYERGVGTRTITSCCYVQPNWQPLPINSYPRPRGATPIYLSFVPAYTPCSTPNRQHGAPLSYGSCAPPARASSALTLGTPDANGLPARSVAFATLATHTDNPATPADEADVRLHVSVTDVRQAGDLAAYSGELQARPVIRITDKDNTPSPGGPGAATAIDVSFPFAVECVASACEADTTANTLLPGAITGGRRTIWQVQGFDLYDAGSAPFLTQGLFIP